MASASYYTHPWQRTLSHHGEWKCLHHFFLAITSFASSTHYKQIKTSLVIIGSSSLLPIPPVVSCTNNLFIIIALHTIMRCCDQAFIHLYGLPNEALESSKHPVSSKTGQPKKTLLRVSFLAVAAPTLLLSPERDERCDTNAPELEKKNISMNYTHTTHIPPFHCRHVSKDDSQSHNHAYLHPHYFHGCLINHEGPQAYGISRTQSQPPQRRTSLK